MKGLDMKNLWFIFIGILIVFALFFMNYTNSNFDNNVKNPRPEKIKVQHTTITETTPNTSSNTRTQPNFTKDSVPDESLPEDEQIYKEEIAEASPEEIEIKSIQKPIAKTTTLSINGATEVKMKIKAKEQDGVVKTKVSITHDMLTYAQAKKKGREANFITHITALVAKRVVYSASTSQFLSKNPLFKFSFKGEKGEELTIIYQQLKGEVFYASKKIK